MYAAFRIYRPTAFTILISMTTAFASYLVAERIYERMPHLEDEIAYTWQAAVYAKGQLTIPSPQYPHSFMVPFIVDYREQRFAKYPPGWPALLALGITFGIRAWVNPLLAGLAVWLTYRLGQKLLGSTAGVLAALLTATSPLFLIYAASLMAHTWSLVLTLIFSVSWLDTFGHSDRRVRPTDDQYSLVSTSHVEYSYPSLITVLVAGLSLGDLALTRPLTALGVALAFFIHGLILWRRGDNQVRRRVLSIGVIAGCIGALLLVWQFAVTGSLWLNPYTLWWKYDNVGFGAEIGRFPGGHNLQHAWINLKSSLKLVIHDLFGWGKISWLFLPIGIWAIRRNYRSWLVVAIPFGLVVVYLAYWASHGARYYYEGLPGLILTTSAGMLSLLGWSEHNRVSWYQLRSLLTFLLFFGLVGYDVLNFLPHRLNELYHRYNIDRSQWEEYGG